MPLPRFAATYLGHPWRWTLLTAKTLAFVHCFVTYGYSLGPAYGPSMLPTFEVLSEWLLISKRHRNGRNLSVGDLVVYKIPIEPNADGIKRVLGLPGDYVLINSPESERDTMIQVSR
ncbi:uncharacterized protein E0L32_008142 [Thyridium curvatum]|uniref:Peptidase S26 domain-containing protein n=1 Tax=Thyridium curvatum TaxID=1093900 RepID=A0A507AW20_9PEZI|nr:uncharacterized protein E0L32_008142 [Thyridium curvatum]TPX10936.1 hypothetical protein E0L32_008142 [Thyridium curvatum]